MTDLTSLLERERTGTLSTITPEDLLAIIQVLLGDAAPHTRAQVENMLDRPLSATWGSALHEAQKSLDTFLDLAIGTKSAACLHFITRSKPEAPRGHHYTIGDLGTAFLQSMAPADAAFITTILTLLPHSNALQILADSFLPDPDWAAFWDAQENKGHAAIHMPACMWTDPRMACPKALSRVERLLRQGRQTLPRTLLHQQPDSIFLLALLDIPLAMVPEKVTQAAPLIIKDGALIRADSNPESITLARDAYSAAGQAALRARFGDALGLLRATPTERAIFRAQRLAIVEAPILRRASMPPVGKTLAACLQHAKKGGLFAPNSNQISAIIDHVKALVKLSSAINQGPHLAKKIAVRMADINTLFADASLPLHKDARQTSYILQQMLQMGCQGVGNILRLLARDHGDTLARHYSFDGMDVLHAFHAYPTQNSLQAILTHLPPHLPITEGMMEVLNTPSLPHAQRMAALQAALEHAPPQHPFGSRLNAQKTDQYINAGVVLGGGLWEISCPDMRRAILDRDRHIPGYQDVLTSVLRHTTAQETKTWGLLALRQALDKGENGIFAAMAANTSLTSGPLHAIVQGTAHQRLAMVSNLAATDALVAMDHTQIQDHLIGVCGL